MMCMTLYDCMTDWLEIPTLGSRIMNLRLAGIDRELICNFLHADIIELSKDKSYWLGFDEIWSSILMLGMIQTEFDRQETNKRSM